MASEMGWSMDQFRKSTPPEVYWSYRGYQRSRGIDPDVKAMTPARGAAISKRVDDQFNQLIRRGAG